MSRITVIARLPDVIAPKTSWIAAHCAHDRAKIVVCVTEENTTIYWIRNNNPTITREELISFGNQILLTYEGIQPPINQYGLANGTVYYFHMLAIDPAINESKIYTKEFQTLATAIVIDISVSNDTELLTASNNSSYSVIGLQPGQYRLANLFRGKNRTSNPLTFISTNVCDKAVFVDTAQRVDDSKYITLKWIIFQHDQGITEEGWLTDNGGGGGTGSVTNFKLLQCEFLGKDPGNKNSATPNPSYGTSLITAMKFTNYRTHTVDVIECIINYCYTIGDFKLNGTVNIWDLYVQFWYFDGIRFIACSDEGRVPGRKLLKRIYINSCLGRYNEIVRGRPHPDHTQGIVHGNAQNNTNPFNSETIFQWCVFNADLYRGTNIQCGLAQSIWKNTLYYECVWTTKSMTHGISLEAGAEGVLIQRMTIVDALMGARCWVRIFKTNAQVTIRDTFFWTIDTASSGVNINGPGLMITQSNNITGFVYKDTFKGPAFPQGTDGIIQTFRPKEDFGGVGALTTDGEFRKLPHAAMMADAPTITGGAGQFTIDVINEPWCMIDEQEDYGGTVYETYDLAYCLAGTYEWEFLTEVEEAETVTGIDAGTYWFMTRCNNMYEGQWSYKAVAVVT